MQQIHLSISAGSQNTWKLHHIMYTPKAELNRIPFSDQNAFPIFLPAKLERVQKFELQSERA